MCSLVSLTCLPFFSLFGYASLINTSVFLGQTAEGSSRLASHKEKLLITAMKTR